MFSRSTGSIFLVLAVSTLALAQYEGSEISSKPFPWPDGKRAALSLSFDDARLSQPDVGIPLLDQYGVKATFYVQPGPLDERLAGWKKAVADGRWLILAGHEIGEEGSQTTYVSMLDALCRYAKDPANGFWIAPVGTVAKYVVEHRSDAAIAR